MFLKNVVLINAYTTFLLSQDKLHSFLLKFSIIIFVSFLFLKIYTHFPYFSKKEEKNPCLKQNSRDKSVDKKED